MFDQSPAAAKRRRGGGLLVGGLLADLLPAHQSPMEY